MSIENPFSEKEVRQMMVYRCVIHKIYIGVMADGMMDRLDGMAVMLAGDGRWWMKKVSVGRGRIVEMVVVVWEDEKGFCRWLKANPGDVKFVERGM